MWNDLSKSRSQTSRINRRKRSPTFYESGNISFNISYLVFTKIFVLYTLCEFLPKIFKDMNLELQ